MAADLHDHKLTNVRIVSHDAVEVFHTQLLDNSLAGVQIFPDPWHKKRHHKRRLIQTAFIQLLVQKLDLEDLFTVLLIGKSMQSICSMFYLWSTL